jgi:hypothetical protein
LNKPLNPHLPSIALFGHLKELLGRNLLNHFAGLLIHDADDRDFGGPIDDLGGFVFLAEKLGCIYGFYSLNDSFLLAGVLPRFYRLRSGAEVSRGAADGRDVHIAS